MGRIYLFKDNELVILALVLVVATGLMIVRPDGNLAGMAGGDCISPAWGSNLNVQGNTVLCPGEYLVTLNFYDDSVLDCQGATLRFSAQQEMQTKKNIVMRNCVFRDDRIVMRNSQNILVEDSNFGYAGVYIGYSSHDVELGNLSNLRLWLYNTNDVIVEHSQLKDLVVSGTATNVQFNNVKACGGTITSDATQIDPAIVLECDSSPHEGIICNPKCYHPEICEDGIDNDLDGLIDEDDPDCPTRTLPQIPSSHEIICHDDFEGDTLDESCGWTTRWGGSGYTWGLSSCKKYTGSQSLFASGQLTDSGLFSGIDTCTPREIPYTFAKLESKFFDFSEANDAYILMSYWLRTGGLIWVQSSDDWNIYDTYFRTDGDQGDEWHIVNISLNQLNPKKQFLQISAPVGVRTFREIPGGAFIDDIYVVKVGEKSDLMAQDIRLIPEHPECDQESELAVYIKNIGLGVSQDLVKTKIFLDGQEVCVDTIMSVAKGEVMHTPWCSLNKNVCDGRPHTLRGEVDVSGILDEIKEDNNVLERSFTCTCGDVPSGAYCGDGTCGSSESELSCPEDCEEEPEYYCGDGTCGVGEDNTGCPEDCTPDLPACGDGVCTEDCVTCAVDCGQCPPDLDVEVCDNFVDDDFDSLIDCDDSDCVNDISCQELPDIPSPQNSEERVVSRTFHKGSIELRTRADASITTDYPETPLEDTIYAFSLDGVAGEIVEITYTGGDEISIFRNVGGDWKKMDYFQNGNNYLLRGPEAGQYAIVEKVVDAPESEPDQELPQSSKSSWAYILIPIILAILIATFLFVRKPRKPVEKPIDDTLVKTPPTLTQKIISKAVRPAKRFPKLSEARRRFQAERLKGKSIEDAKLELVKQGFDTKTIDEVVKRDRS